MGIKTWVFLSYFALCKSAEDWRFNIPDLNSTHGGFTTTVQNLAFTMRFNDHYAKISPGVFVLERGTLTFGIPRAPGIQPWPVIDVAGDFMGLNVTSTNGLQVEFKVKMTVNFDGPPESSCAYNGTTTFFIEINRVKLGRHNNPRVEGKYINSQIHQFFREKIDVATGMVQGFLNGVAHEAVDRQLVEYINRRCFLDYYLQAVFGVGTNTTIVEDIEEEDSGSGSGSGPDFGPFFDFGSGLDSGSIPYFGSGYDYSGYGPRYIPYFGPNYDWKK